MKLSRLIFVRGVCSIGCFIQLLHTTKEFLQFKVRSDVTFENPTFTELPDIDLMVPMAIAINLTELFIRYPDQMSILCSELDQPENNRTFEIYTNSCSSLIKAHPYVSSAWLAHFIKVKDVKELTIDLRTKILRLELQSTKKNLLKRVCSMSRYFSALAIFLRISCRNESRPITVDMSVTSVAMDGFAFLTHTLNSKSGIRLSDNKKLPETTFTYYRTLNDNSDLFQLIFARYSKRVSLSLPYPFETQCQDYDRIKILSELLTNFTLKEPQPYLAPNVLVPWNINLENLGFENQLKEKRDDDEGYEAYEAYEERYKVLVGQISDRLKFIECEQISYSIELKAYPTIASGDFGVVYLLSPSEPIVYLRALTNLPPSEYLIFIGSILGLWFGFSIFDQLRNDCIVKCKNRKRQRVTKLIVQTESQESPINSQSTSQVNVLQRNMNGNKKHWYSRKNFWYIT